MIDGYKIVYQGSEAEIIEKKSRFIATVIPIESEEEATQQIEILRKKYWNATHNCYAYVIGMKQELQRFSDDGEPSQTAGKPMLDVLLGEELHNVLVVVTRYFGGTLLGTGGLVRAYSKATKEGLGQSVIVTKKFAQKVRLECEYTQIGKIQYILAQNDLHILDTIYTDKVQVIVLIPVDCVEEVKKQMIEATSANVQIETLDKVCFAKKEKEIILFS